MKKLLKKIKIWFTKIVLPYLSKNWGHIVNFVVLFISYANVNEQSQPGLSVILGLWIFVLSAYYIFWKLFKFEKTWKNIRKKKN